MVTAKLTETLMNRPKIIDIPLVGMLLLGSLLLPGANAAAAGQVRSLDRIVAVVNSDVITQHELDDRFKLTTQQLKRQNTPLPPREVLEKQLLERMIVDRVQLQHAHETGLRIDEAQLDKTIQRIAQQNNLTLEAFRATLERDGVSFVRFRGEIRNEILLERLREREVDNKIVISDGEIDNYLNTRATQLGGEEEFSLAHILIRVPEQATPEQIRERRARAEQALAALKAQTNFGQVAATYSDAPDAMQGGLLGWRTGSRLPTLFVEAVNALQPGESSAILRSPNGFHILRLIDRRGKDTPLLVQQTRARHILVKTNETVSEADARNRLTQVRERLVNGGNFAELARQYSEDGSASRGGDLGWLSPGATVPDFERAMDALKPGEISAPVHSPFGWHLIEVLERRQEDVSKERQRLQARQELRARKVDDAYETWLRQLRDQAYVEYRQEEK